MVVLIVMTFAFLTWWNFILLKDYRYPPFLYNLIWTIVVTSYYIAHSTKYIQIYELSSTSLIIFLLGGIFFSLGGLSVFFLFKGKKPSQLNIKKYELTKFGKLFLNAIFFISLFVLPIYIKKAIEIYKSSGFDNFFIGLRWQLNYGNSDYGIVKYAASLSTIGVLFYSFFRETLRFKNYLLIVTALIYAILSTGRTNILLLLIILLGKRFSDRQIKLTHIINALLFFILVFFIFSIILGKGGNTNLGFTQNLVLVSQTFLKYLVGSLAAFDNFINSHYDLLYGKHTFRFIYALMYKLKLITEEPVSSSIRGFSFVPFATNVYTVFEYYIRDFNILASLNIIYFIGFIHTFFYFKINKSFVFQALYIIMLYPLLMSFFQDQYFSLLSLWLQFLILLIFFNKFCLRKKNESKTINNHS